MKSVRSDYLPVYGKTYSLFGKSDSTFEYFTTIKTIADKILEKNNDISELIKNLNLFSSKKRTLKKFLRNKSSENKVSSILRFIDPQLRQYTENTEEHLRTLPVSRLFDRRLATSREQYHLYILEIELTNRQFAYEFNKANKKIALLPYCLQDFSVKCKSEKNGFDFQCRHCSARCFQNHVSKILKTHHIEPYIWMEGDMKQLAKYTLKKKLSVFWELHAFPNLPWE